MIFKGFKIFLLILMLCMIGFITVVASQWQHKAVVTTQEIIPDNEPEQTQRAVDNFINVIKTFESDSAHRGAHAKGHACVKAFFTINDIVPTLNHGVFKQEDKRFKAWIRFSNGSPAIQPDTKKDSRGIAIKLLNVKKQDQTQEFLLHNSPAFFSVNLKDYNQLVESDNKIRYFLPGLNPFAWRPRELSHVIDTLASAPYSPIWDQYFSNTAYKLGPHNVKYKVQSCSAEKKSEERSDPDFLQKTLASELKQQEACLEFMVQVQDPKKPMPIEDPSVLWKETDSPYLAVATITILKQRFDTPSQQTFCENLSFTPWNALPEHRPIGALNRVRKLVYQASSLYRHEFNDQQQPTSLDW